MNSQNMSLPNTLESVEDSQISSPSVSQTQQLFVTTNSVKNQHLTLAQMRGVIQIFNHYFPKNAKKRMSRDEKNRKWISYKNRIYQEYRRVVVGKYASEKALVKRYSEPLSFIKYRLKRAKNLNVTDLSETDRQYYYEIGGMEDVNELIKLTYNIDSVEQMSNNFETYNNNRKRRRVENDQQSPSRHHDNVHNHNVNISHSVPINRHHVNDTTNSAQAFNFEPIPKMEKNEKMTEALYVVKDKLDIFEKEQLDKKKIEIFEVTKQKVLAMKQSVEASFMNEPHLIGCIPGIEEQDALAFDCWLGKYRHIIQEEPIVKRDMETFIKKITILRMDNVEWKDFLAKWKMRRIFYDDDFLTIWTKIKSDLNIQDTMNARNEPEQNTDVIDDEDL